MPSLWTQDVATSPAQYQDNQMRAKAQVETYCQSLVDAGNAQWRINGDGAAELHMHSGEIYLFGENGITRIS